MLCRLVKIKSCLFHATLEAAGRKVQPMNLEVLNNQRSVRVMIIGYRNRMVRKKNKKPI